MPATRVAIIAPEGLAGRGGIGRVMTYLVRYLDQHTSNVDIRVYASRLSERAPLSHLSVAPALLWMAIGLLVHQIDVVHINIAPRGSTWRKMLYLRVAKMLGKKVVLHLHGSGYDEFYAQQGARRQALIREFFRSADRVVVLSGFWRRFALDGLQLDATKVVEIPNGAPIAIKEPPKRRVGEATQIAFLGEVGSRKGIDVLINALAELGPDFAKWRLVVGGNGEVAAAAERIAACGLADRVEMLGWVSEDQVDQILRASDIFVLPSRAENQPVSILEAMARAIPVVSTTVGAIPEQVVHGETGLLVPAGDSKALAAALKTLIEDPDLRSRMGAAGHARFMAQFSAAACGDNFAKLYRDMA